MANRQKYTRGTIGHMCRHYERGLDSNREPVKFGNQDIDPERSYLNYNLAKDDQPLPQLEFIHKRMAVCKCLNRKDVNVMMSWVVTLPKEMNGCSEKEKKRFFKTIYEFLKARYGAENVVSAYVHMDENQPHMHFAFTPVIYDEKKQTYKFSAKEVGNKKDLVTFHKDLDMVLEKELGYKTGVINGITEVNLSIKELKEVQKRINKIDKDLEKIKAPELEKTITGNYKSKDIDSLSSVNVALSSKNELLEVKCSELEKERERLLKRLKTNRNINIDKLKQENEVLKSQNEILKKKNEGLELENQNLTKKVEQLDVQNQRWIDSSKINRRQKDVFYKNLVTALTTIEPKDRYRYLEGMSIQVKEKLVKDVQKKIDEGLKIVKMR